MHVMGPSTHKCSNVHCVEQSHHPHITICINELLMASACGIPSDLFLEAATSREMLKHHH